MLAKINKNKYPSIESFVDVIDKQIASIFWWSYTFLILEKNTPIISWIITNIVATIIIGIQNSLFRSLICVHPKILVTNITNEYIYNYQNKDCYFLPIDNQGCIKSVDFDVNNKNILKLGNLRIYDLIKESHLYEKEEKVEKLNYFQEINFWTFQILKLN